MNFKKSILIACAFVAALALVFFLVKPTPSPPRVVPSPNGYDDFLRAGSMMTKDDSLIEDMSLEQLRGYVRTDEAGLKLLREGLKKQSRVSAEFSPADVTKLTSLKRAARALHTEQLVAKKEGRLEDAAEIALQTISYGCASGNGGIIIERFISRACEIIGMRDMTNLVSQLTNKEFCLRASQQIQNLNLKRDPPEQMIENEKAWGKHQPISWRYEIADLFRGYTRKTFSDSKSTMYSLQQQSEHLAAILAARAYELDKGHPPSSWVELTPTYLKTVPVDPVTGKEIPFTLHVEITLRPVSS